MSLIMTVAQECPLSVTFKDDQGNPAQVESGEWSVTDPSIITIHTDPQDLTKAIVAATGVPGTGQVNVKADARFGPDVKEIFGLLDVQIVSSEATVVEISAGTPSDMNPTVTPHAKGKK
jgi:hypothetical protein